MLTVVKVKVKCYGGGDIGVYIYTTGICGRFKGVLETGWVIDAESDCAEGTMG